ncbi:MAG: NAD(P)H-binding protein [Pseudomonadota bacterium]
MGVHSTPGSHGRVLLFGATGTIGRAALEALRARNWDVVCLVRPGTDSGALPGVDVRPVDFSDPGDIERGGIRGETFDAAVSCMASRTGVPTDAWAVDHDAQQVALAAAQGAGAAHFVLLSAICVQKPKLACQHAKLAFEAALQNAGIGYSIVRPTAYFKSLSGQIGRVESGKPYLVFGDGRLTACKPISDRDLGVYLAECLDRQDRAGRILPIGGPGPAITPRAQADHLFKAAVKPPRFRSVPPGFLKAVAAGLQGAGVLSGRARDRAELARIGHYYATESMLLWDAAAGRYDADATPETGSDTLFEFYDRVLAGTAKVDLGDHAVF